MSRRSLTRRLGAPLLAVAASAALALGLAGCGSDDSEGAAGTTTASPTKVTVALDWTPNTNHIGTYVADALGYYADAGIAVKILPYAETAPDTLVDRGTADFGYSYQAGIAYARASGLDVRQVFANIQKAQFAIGVRADQDAISRPRDLDGKTYAGFGTPDEGPELKYVIRKDGGTGDFTTVALNTSAYEAVYNGRADFTISVSTWDGIEAELIGKPMRYFEFTEYGFPQQYSSAISSSDAFLTAHPDVAKGFLAATQKGFRYAADHPDEAAKILLDANPSLKNRELVERSAQKLASEGYLKNGAGQVGTIDAEVWERYGDFLFGEKLLAGSDGKPLATRPDWSEYWTNEYLPAQ